MPTEMEEDVRTSELIEDLSMRKSVKEVGKGSSKAHDSPKHSKVNITKQSYRTFNFKKYIHKLANELFNVA